MARIAFKDFTEAVISFFRNDNTVARTYSFQDRNGTIADDTDLADKVNTTRTVNGHALSSDVTVTASDLSLGNVDNTSDTNKPISSATQTALDAKVDEETFTALVDGSTVAWDCAGRQNPLAKLTSTQSFTINMTNVKSGATGILKLTTNTGSAITVTFDTDFTNKAQNTTVTTHVFPALTGQEYFLYFVCDGTTLEWTFGDAGIYQAWTPTWTGFSTPPVSGVARYTLHGKMCHCHQNMSSLGTSNNTAHTVTLPFAANFGQFHIIMTYSGGGFLAGRLQTQNGSNVALLTTSANGAAFGGSGSEGANFSIVYEIQ